MTREEDIRIKWTALGFTKAEIENAIGYIQNHPDLGKLWLDQNIDNKKIHSTKSE